VRARFGCCSGSDEGRWGGILRLFSAGCGGGEWLGVEIEIEIEERDQVPPLRDLGIRPVLVEPLDVL
jgi:hypothetical protein